ncbi:unnamed protein product [Cyclocybe aegerita]|uniref:FAD-binding domain-containing protein n=1 Tax=Cyclocybe aegerita TaxID=1973307 RepID=A0A8S0XP48_CYCAE|nr:unnamed protein product [Cyclocybe aegerita]
MASEETSRKPRVAICGGGIGGLCLAVMLSNLSHLDVRLYESAGQFKEIGAGVMIWSRTWRILEDMGLASEFAKIAHAPPTGEMGVGFDYRRSDQPEEGFRFKLVEMPYGVHFLDVFVNALPPGIANFGKRLVSYNHQVIRLSSPLQPISLQFADGSISECDLLIGAEGIKSGVRAQMYREAAMARGDLGLLDHISPVWTGTIAYRGLYCGKSKHVVSYSISQGDIVNIVTFTSRPERHGEPYSGDWVVNCDKQELLDSYAGLELGIPSFDLSLSESQLRVHLNQDAFILARLLSKAMRPTRDSLSALLKAYEAVRLPAANAVLRGSYESGRMYEFT